MVKPYYKCAVCSESFSRKSNLRRHCKTQHGYDPFPYQGRGPLHFKQQDVQATFERLKDMTRYFLRAKDLELPLNDINNKRYESSSASLLNYIVEECVFLSKKDVAAISGFFCNQCFAFQFRYIREMGFDYVPREVHACAPAKLNNTNKLQNRIAVKDAIYEQAVECLVALTNSILPGTKYLNVLSYNRTVSSSEFHAPRIKFNLVSPGHWLWSPLVHKEVALTDESLKNFLRYVLGTYGIVSIERGDYSGDHLVYLTNYSSAASNIEKENAGSNSNTASR